MIILSPYLEAAYSALPYNSAWALTSEMICFSIDDDRHPSMPMRLQVSFCPVLVLPMSRDS
jgi:hypothetical protein